jgi:hypothetical protein
MLGHHGAAMQEESLTVRRADFHPVARHLLRRDLSEIDIAELSYGVLSWSAMDVAQLFGSQPTALSVVQAGIKSSPG